MPVCYLTNRLVFPPAELAAPSGLLAVGGDLSVNRLLLAYRSGIFPWYSGDNPILWWSPDPRLIFLPENLKISDSMRRIIKSGRFQVTFDSEFRKVISSCRKAERRNQDGTWITKEIAEAYCRLHEAGHAHSVEVWLDGKLAGGLYGLNIGRCFCGESMFTSVSNASKVGFILLVEKLIKDGITLIDCQVPTDHLKSLGAREVPRSEFLAMLKDCLA